MLIRIGDPGFKYNWANSLTSLPVLGIHLESRPVLYGEAMVIELGMQVDELEIVPK